MIKYIYNYNIEDESSIVLPNLVHRISCHCQQIVLQLRPQSHQGLSKLVATFMISSPTPEGVLIRCLVAISYKKSSIQEIIHYLDELSVASSQQLPF